MPSSVSSPVAIVLPPKEGFSAEAVGAIGLLVRRLARQGRPSVVLGQPVAHPFPDVAFRPVPAPRWPLGVNRAYAASAARVLRALRPALIEVHNRPDLALHLARAFPGLPVALFLNNDPQDMRRARSAAERAALLGRLARVVTASDWLRRRLLDGVPAPPRPPVVLPNCLDPAELPPLMPPEAREKLILFAGRMVADKGADSFVAACARALPLLPGWRAEMIGADRFSPNSPDTPFLRALRPQAAAAGIVLSGHRPHAEVLRAMARAAIVAVPSRWPEPFGLAAVEAMACGAALVASGRGGLAEVTGEAALIADPDDSAALAEAFLALARDPAHRAALAEAGRARAALFDVSRAGAALEALRAELIGGG